MNQRRALTFMLWILVIFFLSCGFGCVARLNITSLSMEDIPSYSEDTTIADFIDINTTLSDRFLQNNHIVNKLSSRFKYKHVFTIARNGHAITCLNATLHQREEYYYVFHDGTLERIVYSYRGNDTGGKYKDIPVKEWNWQMLADEIIYVCRSDIMTVDRYNDHERRIILENIKKHYSMSEPPPVPLVLVELLKARTNKERREYLRLMEVFNAAYLQIGSSCDDLDEMYGVHLDSFHATIEDEDFHILTYGKEMESKSYREPYVNVICKENQVKGAITTFGSTFDREELVKLYLLLATCPRGFGIVSADEDDN